MLKGLDIRALMFRRRDIAGLVAFRILFGGLMTYDVLRHLLYGWIHAHFIEPQLNLKYLGFEWVQPLAGAGMYAVFGLMLATGLAIVVGLYYRLSAAIFFVLHTYVFLVAAEFYLNHAYLISIVAFVMVVVPAHRALSFDVLRKPELQTDEIHAWPYVVVCALIGIVFTFGSVAKINPDWLAGEPVRHWLDYRAESAQEPFASWLRAEWCVYLIAYGGVLYDLLVTPALIWRRTRVYGVLFSVGFHMTNHYLFNIGVFPWFMLCATTLFFEPSWPRKLGMWVPSSVAPYVNRAVAWAFAIGATERAPADDPLAVSESRKRWILAFSGAFTLLMVAVPLRHYLYPSYVGWTEEGHVLAWRMKLRDKEGDLSFRIVDKATGERWVLHPNRDANDRQVRKMVGRPDLLLYYVHLVAKRYRAEGRDVEIYADSLVSLNFRPKQRLIDPTVDLAAEPNSLMPYPWLTEFEDTPMRNTVPPVHSHLDATARRLARRAGPPGTLAPPVLAPRRIDFR